MASSRLHSREEVLQTIEAEYGLLPQHIYLLELIPLIEMIWADGKVQQAEISLLYDFAIRHLAELSNAAGGQEVIGVDDANAFLDRFLNEQPDPAELKGLRELALSLNRRDAEPEVMAKRRDTLLGACMDIAAAAVVDYPYEKHERIMETEKRLLTELMTALHLSPERRI